MARLFLVFILICFCSGAPAQPVPRLSTPLVRAQASTQYADPSLLRRVLLGTNYRKVWEMPVDVPVFRIRELGLSIVELGGGMQTKSLKLKDSKGIEWVLRTIEKDVTPNLPPRLQNTLAERVVQDMISAAHPYAPLTIPPLAKAIGLVVPEPVLYYVPEDPALAPYTDVFANSLCFLEEREPTLDNSDTKGTDDVLEVMVKRNNTKILQEEVLKARLLDMLLADWDRHADQWRWGPKDSAGLTYYYAIPRDRDQAYFSSNGILIKIARYVAARHFVGFRPSLSKLTNLNFKAWKFDKTFINELDRQEWSSIIEKTVSALTDATISAAIRKLPPEVYAQTGATIEQKLKKRRDDLQEAGMRYYYFLTSHVRVNGTDESELFTFRAQDEGINLAVYDLKNGEPGRMLYNRTFQEDETDDITLTGLGGSDRFIIDRGVTSRIRVNIWGGEGADVYLLNGKMRNTIFEETKEGNSLELNNYTRFRQIKR